VSSFELLSLSLSLSLSPPFSLTCSSLWYFWTYDRRMSTVISSTTSIMTRSKSMIFSGSVQKAR
jgi:hypothetical protein